MEHGRRSHRCVDRATGPHAARGGLQLALASSDPRSDRRDRVSRTDRCRSEVCRPRSNGTMGVRFAAGNLNVSNRRCNDTRRRQGHHRCQKTVSGCIHSLDWLVRLRRAPLCAAGCAVREGLASSPQPLPRMGCNRVRPLATGGAFLRAEATRTSHTVGHNAHRSTVALQTIPARSEARGSPRRNLQGSDHRRARRPATRRNRRDGCSPPHQSRAGGRLSRKLPRHRQ